MLTKFKFFLLCGLTVVTSIMLGGVWLKAVLNSACKLQIRLVTVDALSHNNTLKNKAGKTTSSMVFKQIRLFFARDIEFMAKV